MLPFDDVANVLPVITGAGLVSPLGSTVEQTWSRLLAGDGVRGHARACCGAEDDRQPRLLRIALSSAKQALHAAQWDRAILEDDQTALVIGTSKGTIEQWIAPPNISKTPYLAGESYGVAELGSEVRSALRMGSGAVVTLSAACATGLHALIRAALMIRSGEAPRVLVVAAESSLHPLFVGSFARLGVLAREGVGCKPFDVQRDGFLMSEAAAAVCVEGVSADQVRDSRTLAVIERFALGADATHLTAGDPDGRVLRRLMAQVMAGKSVDLVHAHGTGTIRNDPVELTAIEATMSDPDLRASQDDPSLPPILYSHKGALGHSLGAAGLVSVVLNCQSHRQGIVPPNAQTTHPLPTRHLRLSSYSTHAKVRRSLCLAAGFGGASAAIALRNP